MFLSFVIKTNDLLLFLDSGVQCLHLINRMPNNPGVFRASSPFFKQCSRLENHPSLQATSQYETKDQTRLIQSSYFVLTR
jgi:hypothetical protein